MPLDSVWRMEGSQAKGTKGWGSSHCWQGSQHKGREVSPRPAGPPSSARRGPLTRERQQPHLVVLVGSLVAARTRRHILFLGMPSREPSGLLWWNQLGGVLAILRVAWHLGTRAELTHIPISLLKLHLKPTAFFMSNISIVLSFFKNLFHNSWPTGFS